MKFYVSWIREYPIYEPAEGGYYYEGETVIYCKEFANWKKAKRDFFSLLDEFTDYIGIKSIRKEFLHEDDNIYVNLTGGVGKFGNHPYVGYSTGYVGQGEYIQITRRKPENHGRVPYC